MRELSLSRCSEPYMDTGAGAELSACLRMGRSHENEGHSEDSVQKERRERTQCSEVIEKRTFLETISDESLLGSNPTFAFLSTHSTTPRRTRLDPRYI